MTYDEYLAIRNDPRRPLELAVYCVQAPSLPPRPAAPPPPRRPAPTRPAPTRPMGHHSGEPSRVCRACLEPAHLVAATLMCERCAAEVGWRVGLLRQGLRVVP